MDSKLIFDPKKHVYRLDGVIVPGVTTVIQAVGLIDFSMVKEDVLKYAADRGTAVHLACEYYDNNELDVLPDLVKPYLDQYIKFIKDFDVQMIEVEKKIFCKKYFYAGTLDRVAVLRKKSSEPVLFDIKTCKEDVSHKVQTAAYEYAYKADKRKKMDRYTLTILEDKYILSEPYRGRQDFDVFLGALSVYNYKKIGK